MTSLGKKGFFHMKKYIFYGGTYLKNKIALPLLLL
ncbi:hypothetical protein SAMN05421736_11618 [Evansella caseinilytica]|uniref:Uncharacterized protein n=1 Tax=Evansella caseinilytica TaxID=1503961 RepID=A0A1H3TSV4_9BACI|nr:hypothetical protein SAMN05421736_11618 [Evansella caseinilytica]